MNTFGKYLGGYICKWSRTVSAVTVLQQPPLTFTVSHSRPTKSITTTTITPTTTTNIDSLHKCWLFNFVLESVLSFDHSIKLPMEYCRRQNFHGYWAGTRSGRGNSSFFQRKLFIRSKNFSSSPNTFHQASRNFSWGLRSKAPSPLSRVFQCARTNFLTSLPRLGLNISSRPPRRCQNHRDHFLVPWWSIDVFEYRRHPSIPSQIRKRG